jgi:DDE superfamily endonuclease
MASHDLLPALCDFICHYEIRSKVRSTKFKDARTTVSRLTSAYRLRLNGTANIFMMFAPLEGWRHVKVTDRHTAVDYAHVLKELADVHFANAKTIVLVQDNLNIHSKASLYEAFIAAEARRLVERFEWHYTPKHGSWLDLAESELGVLSSQCLDRRIPDKQTLMMASTKPSTAYPARARHIPTRLHVRFRAAAATKEPYRRPPAP